eukprot:TRINITY_DN102654_c0_g1_i1.p1 TRINITY_DN102654_c0_g1~~TRINITY_DN102654_c0_g1_i1.p1  ORF type:complete len:624 (-),score=53.65 TRINITY_DN102654_c0_g1_i1:128-1999(-)
MIASRFPVGAPTAHFRVVVLSRPDDDSHFEDVTMVGHPDNIKALQAAGIDTKIVRASCLCLARRLCEEQCVTEILEDGRNIMLWQAASHRCQSQDAKQNHNVLARGLTHARCLIDAACSSSGSAVIFLEASAKPVAGPGSAFVAALRQTMVSFLSRQEDMLLLAAGNLAAAYALSSTALKSLQQQESEVCQAVTDANVLIASLAGQKGGSHVSLMRPFPRVNSATLFNASGRPSVSAPQKQTPCPPLSLKGKPEGQGRVKVVVITLPHREDRRAKPLVGSPEALSAMREAGFDVEILRASCYCERDRLNLKGGLSCFVDGCESQWMRFRRYPGAEDPLTDDEEELLRENLNSNYGSGGGADRLVDPEDGGMQTFLLDTNWPGATSCALSHLRALVGAAVAGYEHAVIFEDDAIISGSAARQRGWCHGCTGPVCMCPTAWADCLLDAIELMKAAEDEPCGGMDLLYLGLGEEFEPPEELDSVRADPLSASTWLSNLFGQKCDGVTRIGYTWCAHSIVYSRRALDDVLALRLWELVWAQDETIPHMYGRHPWNPRFVKALQMHGWQRRWVAGAPSDCFRGKFNCFKNDGWVWQLEMLEDIVDVDKLEELKHLQKTAQRSSNSQEF